MNTTEKLHELFLKYPIVSTDTRKIQPNSLFFCLKGQNFDANTFAQEALNKGAQYVIIDDKNFYINDRTVLVTDVLTSLQNLATYHRNYLELPIIALTGSNGKTTTKELINAVLSKKFTTKATQGNLNNHIGVPLTLLSFDDTTEIGIVEMGANHQKEIAFLCSIAQPDYGYITNFGKAHLEGFGGVEGVIKGKSEMYDFLQNHKKIAFLNLDDPIQKNRAKELKNFSFSKGREKADVLFQEIESGEFAKTKINQTIIQSRLVGGYNVNNINAAVTIGKYFDIKNSVIKDAIEGYVPSNNRSQLTKHKSNEIILDCYNANPSSMSAAIENFLKLNKRNKWLILGDMFELGEESFEEHHKIVLSLANVSNHKTFFIGSEFYKHHSEASKNSSFFKTFDDFKKYINSKSTQNKTILIKGSRGMALERTLDIL